MNLNKIFDGTLSEDKIVAKLNEILSIPEIMDIFLEELRYRAKTKTKNKNVLRELSKKIATKEEKELYNFEDFYKNDTCGANYEYSLTKTDMDEVNNYLSKDNYNLVNPEDLAKFVKKYPLKMNIRKKCYK